MRRSMLLVATALVVIVGASAARPASSVQRRWVITDLGGVPGMVFSQAVAISERGQVIGNSYPCVDPSGAITGRGCASARAFVWQKGRVTRLGTLGGAWTIARDLNNSGQVVGYGTTRAGTSHAVLWRNGAVLDLGTLPGMRESMASDINERGQVVGVSYNVDRDCGSVYEAVCDEHAFVWQQGKLTDLGTLGGKSSEAVAINERGQVIGWSKARIKVRSDSGEVCSGPDTTVCVTPRHAFLWQKGKMSDLGTLPFHTIGSWAVAINGRAQIVGVSSWASGGNGYDERPFRWQNGKMVDLGTLQKAPGALQPGIGGGTVHSINERGQIIGASGTLDGLSVHATLWQNRSPIDLAGLGDLGGYSDTSAINDRGQIIGSSSSEPARSDEFGFLGDSHALVWERGKMTVLGALPGGKNTRAVAINEHDQIVGSSTTSTGGHHAVLWTLRSG